MKKYYSIRIPEPCHENWNLMAPEEKGRFCDSCTKTVIDFTKMNAFEVQDFIHQNKGNRICGHFKQTQLDSINIRVPSQVLEEQLSFHKLFLIALLFAMGTSLINCTGKDGAKQKIDSIEIINNETKEVIDVTLGLPLLSEFDSLPKQECNPSSKNNEIIETLIDGELIVGDIDYKKVDSITAPQLPIIDITGLVIDEPDDEVIVGYIVADTPPEFKETPAGLSTQEKKDYFQKRISEYFTENYNTKVCLELKGKQKVYTRFEIDTIGNIKNIKVRAPHPALEKEAKRVIGLLPQFIPAQQSGKAIKVVYTLPVVFQIEE